MSQRGSVLIMSYLVVATLIVWQTIDFQQSLMQARSATTFSDTSRAFHLAEAGFHDALAWMRAQPAPPSGTLAFDPFLGTTGCSVADPTQPPRAPRTLGTDQFYVCVDPDDNNPTTFLDLYTLSIAGLAHNGQIARRITALLRTESFARFSYFTNREELPNGTNIWFTGNDHLTGPVHSNDQFNIKKNPIFDGAVSSTAGSINYYSGGPPADNPQFNGGLTLSAAPISMPLSATPLRVAASSGGRWYEGNTTIVLQNNGTMRVTNATAGLSNAVVSLPANGAVFVNGGNVTLSGELEGALTIGTSHDIVVINNVRYHCNPRDPAADPDCLDGSGQVTHNDDVLGLVAERNVVVSDSAPFNVEIQSSIMALNTSFTVERYWDPANLNGTLTVYGGIIQKSRGAVGTFASSTGQKVSGYSKDYYYDERLAGTAPPFYPTTADYEELLWQEN